MELAMIPAECFVDVQAFISSTLSTASSLPPNPAHPTILFSILDFPLSHPRSHQFPAHHHRCQFAIGLFKCDISLRNSIDDDAISGAVSKKHRLNTSNLHKIRS
jgi:hypothetical protein